MVKIKSVLNQSYYNARSPGSYGGVQRLYRQVKSSSSSRKKDKPTVERVRAWLQGQDTYTLHKPIRRRFLRRRVIVGGLDHQWQADLVDLASLSQYNNGYKYLLTIIDVLSKYAWVVPLKTKTGAALVNAFTKVFRERQPLALQTDKGAEFINRNFQTFLKKRRVHFFTTENEDVKASIVERFNRTLKSRMWRYFTRQNGSPPCYVRILPDLVRSYNASYHRSIKMAPNQVDRLNAEKVWHNLYSTTKGTSTPPAFQPGNRVRISKARRTFKKGYLPNWSEELFTIVRRQPRTLPYVYVLRDDAGDLIKGTFYEQELQKVDDKVIFLIEQILQRRGKRVLVRWRGYPPSFDSWVLKKDLVEQYKR